VVAYRIAVRPPCIRTSGSALTVLSIALLLTGCAASPQRSGAAVAAQSFVAALERGDGVAACGLLSPEAAQSAPGATDASCADAISSVNENGRSATGVQVWGSAAQVRIGSDVVFLQRISGRWLVSAAGCKQQPVGPYQCQVSG
jgi:hypothetical protein